jgi:hypothetical protein
MVLIFSFDAQALPGSPAPAQMAAPDVMLVRDFCGLGFHRGPYGACRPNGVPYGYVAPRGRSSLCCTGCGRAAGSVPVRLLLLWPIRPLRPHAVRDSLR